MKNIINQLYTKFIVFVAFVSRSEGFSNLVRHMPWFWSDNRLSVFYEEYRALRKTFFVRYKEMIVLQEKTALSTKSLWEKDERGFDMAIFRHKTVHSTIRVLRDNLDALAPILRECEKMERILARHHNQLEKLGIRNYTPILLKDPIANMSRSIEHLEDDYCDVKWGKGLVVHGI